MSSTPAIIRNTHRSSLAGRTAREDLEIAPAKWCWLLPLCTVLVLLCGAGRAAAHPDLDEAKRLAADLEFERALSSFEAALSSGSLTREELIQLLSERSFVFHALRRKDDLVRDFIWLSALSPDHRLDLRAAPDLTAIWTSVRDQGRGALSVELVLQPAPAGRVDVRASLTGTVPEGARARLWLQKGDGAFGALPRPELQQAALAGASLALYAEAVGLGGVVVSADHSRDDPLRVSPSTASEDNAPTESGPSWASRHKGWLIGGAVVVAAAVVLTSVLIVRSGDEKSDETALKPVVSF